MLKNLTKLGLLSFLLSTLGAHASLAQSFEPKIGLHAQSVVGKNACTSEAPTIGNCPDASTPSEALVVNWPADGTPTHVYAILTNIPLSGSAGAVFGIRYESAVADTWTNCGDLDFPGNNFPASGGGNVVTFQECQDSVIDEGAGLLVLGFFYMTSYANDLVEVTPRLFAPNQDLAWANCNAAEIAIPYPSGTGTLGFGKEPGQPPCSIADPVEPSTWGGIKRNLDQ
ncbi:MAG: hypothetical protein HKN21_12845 [Candidatus Eisenbacteria bacterium]|uniref:Uncharacterized protein n=1 Tax=Eiseniibacteriota bacterium TaxID=2212470 RepID=A0A7Y2H3B1_UNCEI|nr:hypothetical protein [Candidatus Eisenbacteria bacterium]